MLKPMLKKDDRRARVLIIFLSVLVFLGVAALSRIELEADLGFDAHIFASINAGINTVVTLLLVWALVEVKRKHYLRHKRIMLSAIILSGLFLISYIMHHLFAGDTSYGGEGPIRYFYYFVLITHILLAGIILPFILFTAYRALTAEYDRHRKLARFTWPLWFYVSFSGVLVYWMISPYYG